MGRYDRNGTCINPQETALLHEKRVCVVGCGGLGGYLIEMLVRAGVGHLTVIDSDVFEDTNLNRQLLALETNLGQPKAEAAERRIQQVNGDTKVTALVCRITAENASEIFAGHDLILDAVDSVAARLVMEDACEKLGIPLVHGAIGGWYGQVCVVWPGDRILHQIYEGADEGGVESIMGTPSFVPAAVASMQVAEALKVLLEKGDILRGRLLYMDLLKQNYQIIPLRKNE